MTRNDRDPDDMGVAFVDLDSRVSAAHYRVLSDGKRSETAREVYE